MFLNSIKVCPWLSLIIHLKKEPLPLPILEFFDFLDIGKLPFKNTQILK
jgi:hypothetical protein